MAEGYEYAVKVGPKSSEGRPRSLWRRVGSRWEYLSLLDWRWHQLPDDRGTQPPSPENRVVINTATAHRLESDRQAFVDYWAEYPTGGDAATSVPYTVLRRRRSPELVFDEAYGRHGWTRTSAVFEWESGRTSQPPNLVPVDSRRADELLARIRGVTGGTAL